ncbi:MAG: LAGLIDADG family homing endonuclease [Actinobacteria bacterium]|nr:LAGLIDADG family homing endonuclease [Actinomycetota bacterium]
MGSENPSGADNQQETIKLELDPQWVVGFVDGEGCFSVSIHANPIVRRTRGWQVHPVFHVYQHERYRAVLEELVVFFGCGRVRSKGPNSSVLTFAVDTLADQVARVVPFFERYPLVIKRADFALYAAITRSVQAKEHLEPAGFERVVRLAYAMNAQGKQRKRTLEEVLMGSSETARQAPQ